MVTCPVSRTLVAVTCSVSRTTGRVLPLVSTSSVPVLLLLLHYSPGNSRVVHEIFEVAELCWLLAGDPRQAMFAIPSQVVRSVFRNQQNVRKRMKTYFEKQ